MKLSTNPYLPEITPIKVWKKDVRRSDTSPPCVQDTVYSLDEGKTWMTDKQYFQWRRNLLHVTTGSLSKCME